MDETIWKSNVLFKLIPHITGGEDCRAKVNETVFQPVNDFLKRTGSKFLCGDSIGQADIEFAYLTAMCNMIGLLWDGRSLIEEEVRRGCKSDKRSKATLQTFLSHKYTIIQICNSLSLIAVRGSFRVS